jgi:hypothetical protein
MVHSNRFAHLVSLQTSRLIQESDYKYIRVALNLKLEASLLEGLSFENENIMAPVRRCENAQGLGLRVKKKRTTLKFRFDMST